VSGGKFGQKTANIERGDKGFLRGRIFLSSEERVLQKPPEKPLRTGIYSSTGLTIDERQTTLAFTQRERVLSLA